MNIATELEPEGRASANAEGNPDVLRLDAETRADLDLFESASGAQSLFEFCNVCRTEGGTEVLRRRMESPWSSAARIRATQESLAFILENRAAFADLPSEYVALNVERYVRDSLPMVRETGVVTFAISAFLFWLDEDRFYTKILRGIQVTRRLLRAVRRFVSQVRDGSPGGELAPLLDEMQALIELPRLSQVADRPVGRRYWRKLRVDQALRLHDKAAIIRLLQLVYEMDALVAMAAVTRKRGFVLPNIESGAVRLKATGLVHPFVADAVANPVELDQDRRVLFLTGPNMAGKTTYLRAVATAIYFAHLGMGVPATTFNFVPVQRLFSSIAVSDNLNGVSYFRAEALRVKAVAKAVADGYHVIAIMDEPFKGTNVKDAFDASLAILQRFAASEECLFLVSSHLIELSERLSETDHVDYRYFEAGEQQERLRFDYVLHSGVSNQRLGMRVLSEEGVFDLLDGGSYGASEVADKPT